MLPKLYIDGRDLTRDSFRLARAILDSGWIPESLIGLWRGGSPVAIAVHEFLAYRGHAVRHAVVKCASYTGIGRRSEVRFENLDAVLANVPVNGRVLIVDDIVDTGHTAQECLRRLRSDTREVRLAALYWKPSRSLPGLRPDYFVHRTEEWVVFPHELEGLTLEEVRTKDSAVYDLLVRP